VTSGPSDLVQHCVAQRCSSLCSTARALRSCLHAGRLIPPLQADSRDQGLSSREGSCPGWSNASRTHAMRVQDETLNPKPLSTDVVDYSDVHQDQQQEVSNFLMKSFF
jgi:hypothetical protein